MFVFRLTDVCYRRFRTGGIFSIILTARRTNYRSDTRRVKSVSYFLAPTLCHTKTIDAQLSSIDTRMLTKKKKNYRFQLVVFAASYDFLPQKERAIIHNLLYYRQTLPSCFFCLLLLLYILHVDSNELSKWNAVSLVPFEK